MPINAAMRCSRRALSFRRGNRSDVAVHDTMLELLGIGGGASDRFIHHGHDMAPCHLMSDLYHHRLCALRSNVRGCPEHCEGCVWRVDVDVRGPASHPEDGGRFNDSVAQGVFKGERVHKSNLRSQRPVQSSPALASASATCRR